ncbi:MAG TPA: sigma-70 family RNA polymerase sigma factor [Rectinemataceae bacterium]|nr:sigma-70 family RNA polymerase sigma factor [Rectinemataceae bacterium]
MDDLVAASDARLAAQAASGDRRAFELLATRWWERMLRYAAAAVAGDAQLAEEAAQDALMRLHRALPRFRGDSAFGTFLYRICRNAAIDALRSQARRRRHYAALSEEEEARLPSAHRGPEESLLRHDEGRALRKALDRLRPDERSLIFLKEAEGMGMDELVRVFGLPEGTVKSRLFRARAKLRTMLEEDGYVID